MKRTIVTNMKNYIAAFIERNVMLNLEVILMKKLLVTYIEYLIYSPAQGKPLRGLSFFKRPSTKKATNILSVLIYFMY